MNYWINKEVKGTAGTESWGTIRYKGFKIYNEGEKEMVQEAREYQKFLEDKLAKETDPKKQKEIDGKITATKNLIEDMGKDPSIEAMLNVLFNKRIIYTVLAWNPKSQITNRAQGWLSGMINDTGRYWPEGAFYTSNAFVNKRILSLVPGSDYARQMLICKLLIERMDVIQDNTNEIDRARRKSGIRSVVSKLSPFHLVEVVEWHNQVPQILSMMQGMEIEHATKKDSNGDPLKVKVFDGGGFPAFEVVDGRMQLKPGFDTEANKKTWEDFTSTEASQNKRYISDTIAFLNGDYSKLGSTFAKSTLVGKAYMMFKTWVSKQALLRLGTNQKNINHGLKDFDGAYVGALKSGKTRVAGMVGIATLATVAGVTTAGLAPLALAGAGIVGYTGLAAWAKYRGKDTENVKTLQQGLFMIGAILHKVVSIPVNTISTTATGKMAIKSMQPTNLNLTEEEKQNLRFLVNECAGLLTILWVKLLVKAMMGGGDDDEPEKIIVNGKKVPNPNYVSEKDKTWYNLLENQITSLLSSGVMWHDPVEMVSMIGGVQMLDRWRSAAEDVNETWIREVIKGEDEIATGIDAGKSFAAKKFRNNFVPAIFKDVLEGDPFKFGFGSIMKKEYKTDEWVDYWMQSDFKGDKAKIKKQRKEYKQKLIEALEAKVDFDKYKDNPAKLEKVKARIKRRAEKLLNRNMPANIRSYYDQNQNLIGTDPLDYYENKLDTYLEKLDDGTPEE
jgi:hypothetical protein